MMMQKLSEFHLTNKYMKYTSKKTGNVPQGKK